MYYRQVYLLDTLPTGVVHTYWYWADLDGTKYVLDAGPTTSTGGWLNQHLAEGTQGYFPKDTLTNSLAFTSNNCAYGAGIGDW